jgi:hypothetical protein
MLGRCAGSERLGPAEGGAASALARAVDASPGRTRTTLVAPRRPSRRSRTGRCEVRARRAATTTSSRPTAACACPKRDAAPGLASSASSTGTVSSSAMHGSPAARALDARMRTHTTAASPADRTAPVTLARAASCTGSQLRSTAPTSAMSSSPARSMRAPTSSARTPESSSALMAKPGPRASSCPLRRLAGMLGMVPSTPAASSTGVTESCAARTRSADQPSCAPHSARRQRAP